MRKITSIILFMFTALIMSAAPLFPPDTTFQYNNRKVVIMDNDDELNISVYHLNAQGDTVVTRKVYEGIFSEERSIERRYETGFEIFVSDIFKPKNKRCESRSQWSGFGIGFANLPEGFDFDGELASVLRLSRSRQYNLNLLEGSWRMGNSIFTGITGMGIQFNSMHLQRNKAIEVMDYHSVMTTTDAGNEYNKSRLHYTYLTFPLLIETSWNIGQRSFFFINAGIVAKVKTASSSKVWYDNENGEERKKKLPGDLNLRPVTFDLLAQAGINNVGFFVSYTPLSLFNEHRGPKANQATIGMHYYF
ncbi:MAG: outer membrane beta-barrel protein [Proteiniphilum sp.]|nr:outer membrane beta-barrel protein [Proteiniphilum sp.]